jgi:TolB protein
MKRFTCWLLAAVALAAVASPMRAQQDTTRGVRIGLSYQPGVKPGVAVMPVSGSWGDTVQAMLQRDLDFGDRVTVMSGDAVNATATAQGSGGVNFGVWSTLGAAAVVQVALAPTGAHVILYDIAARRVAQMRDFPLGGRYGDAHWRLDVHGMSDEIERWITGVRGIARTRILYVRAGRIYVIDSDGYGAHAVTDAGTVMGPAWSPDGHTIAYGKLGAKGWSIEIRDLDTGAEHTLSATPGGLNMTPAFAPDGKSIAYGHGLENGTDIYVASVSGGTARRVTVGRGTDNVSPSFSPDGSRLAFTSGRNGHPEVYTADIDGSNTELLTPFNFGDQNYRSNPEWSPDGLSIAFQSQLAGRFQIMIITLRDRTVKQLTNDGINEDPSWAPDGRHLVFTSSRTGARQLFVLDAESGRTRQLTHADGARLAAWSRYLPPTP